MKIGTENRKKTIWAGALAVCALLFVGTFLYNQLWADNSPKPVAPIAGSAVGRAISANNAEPSEQAVAPASRANDAVVAAGTMPTGSAGGAEATKIATSSASLDPTLDESAMLRTEHLVYSGSGRNIFSLVYVPEVKVDITKVDHSPRPTPGPPVHVDLPKPATCPPSCPPINLKFFGTATRANGSRQAFLLQGEDVFLASQGDIVARKYKIVSIASNSIQVEDLTNNNTQTLPLQSN
jgi:hypothetical protein